MTAAPTPKPRSFPIASLDGSIRKHWLGGSVLATHLANGVNLLFPAGERFFVRSVRHYLKQIADDPSLIERVKGFAGQEGHHARAHEQVFEVLEGQGFEIRRFLKIYETIGYKLIEPAFPAAYRLAATAAAEHFTAVMAQNFLTEVGAGEDIDPVMKRLFQWHACEEIEHRSVAFDVFQKVDGRYAVRMAGLAIATVLLGAFWVAASLHLLAQEKDVRGVLKRELDGIREHQPFGDRVFGRGIRAYVARDFHPDQDRSLDRLASAFMEKLVASGGASVAA